MGDLLKWAVIIGLGLTALQFALWIFAVAAVGSVGVFAWLWDGLKKRRVVPIAVVVALVGVTGWFVGHRTSSPNTNPVTSQLDIARTDWLAKTGLSTEQQKRLEPFYVAYIENMRETTAGAQWLESTKPTDVVAQAPMLAMAGLERLPDSDVDSAMEIFRASMTRLDSTACAHLLTNPKKGDWELTSMSVLDSARVASWYAIASRAVVAELRGSPPAQIPDSTAVAAAGSVLAASMPMAERLQVGSVLSSPEGRTTGEVCRALVVMLNNMVKLPEPSRTVMARRMFSLGTR